MVELPQDLTFAIAVLLVLLIGVLALLALFGHWFLQHRAALWQRADAAWRWVQATRLVRWLACRFPRVWRFLGHRLSPEGYLGLHLTIGMLLSLLALLLFGEIANDVVGNDDLVRVDLALADQLHSSATPLGVRVFSLITLLGSFPVMLALGVIVGLLLLQRGQRRLLAVWIVGLAGRSLLNFTLKALFQRPRPEFDAPLALASGWSFPSGHAMGSLVGYGLLAYVILRTLHRYSARVGVLGGALVLVLLIGFSRMYLGVHYLSDVIAGYAAGVVWLTACISGIEAVRRRRDRSDRQRRMPVNRR